MLALFAAAIMVSPPDADRCTAIAGYAAFRSRLEQVAARRDGRGLAGLFSATGAMRVDGVSRFDLSPPVGEEGRALAPVWRALTDVLAGGCGSHDGRLLLPGYAVLAETGEVEPGTWLILARTAMRSAPSATAPRRGWLRPGARIVPEIHDVGDGFAKFRWRGRPAYVPTRSLHSPHGFRLELEREEGEWRIRSFGDGV